MMAFNASLEGKKSSSSIETRDSKSIASKTSNEVGNVKSNEDAVYSKRPKTASGSDNLKPRKNVRVRSKTVDGTDLSEKKPQVAKSEFSPRMSHKRPEEKCEKGKSETSLRKKILDGNGSQKSIKTSSSQNDGGSTGGTDSGISEETESKGSVQRKLSDCSGFSMDNGSAKVIKIKKISTSSKKPSEIPKLKSLKGTAGNILKINNTPSKLPVKTVLKDTDLKSESKTGDSGPGKIVKPEPIKVVLKSLREKKEAKFEEKLKSAMSDDFSALVPLYEKEFKKITDVWVNTIYCSLTMRTNLVKLLFQAFPQINRSQFQTEDEKLLHCIAHAKNYTKSETDSLIQFIRTLITNREKVKEQYSILMANKEIAEIHNNDWRKLTRKIADLGEETKQLQMEAPELQKKKEAHEIAQREKIRSMEMNLASKDEEFQKLEHQLNILKQKELTYRGNILVKVKDYKEIKADVQSLKSMEKEFEDLKAKYLNQNEMYEKKIKDLELLLEEKKMILKKEKEVKGQLQTFLNQLQAQQRKLALSIGKEQLEYVMGSPRVGRDKRREHLWMAAVKLVLRGFLIQMKKLERDRNKMLLELQSNNSDNFNAIATSIIKKDNFIKSIKHQMNDFQKACKFSNPKSEENSCIENL